MLTESILLKQDYDKILFKVFELTLKDRITMFLTEQYDKYVDDNKDFWITLFDRLNKKHLKEFNPDRAYNLKHQDTKRDFSNRFEIEYFVYSFISNKFLNINLQKLELKHLLKIEQRLNELDNYASTEIKRKFTRNLFLHISDELLRITIEGDFTVKEINQLAALTAKKRILSKLISYYFSIEKLKNELTYEDEILIYDTNERGKEFAIVSLNLKNIRIKAKEVFFRAHKFYSNRAKSKHSDFIAFQDFETERWKAILQHFDHYDIEYGLIKKYISKISTFVKSKLKDYEIEDFYFGFNEHHQEILYQLLKELTEAVDFIYIPDNNKRNRKEITENTIREVVSFLTSKDYRKTTTKIYFGCATTTACYILDLLNKKISTKGLFNPYKIGDCKRFYISPSKTNPLSSPIDKFKLLTRVNYVKGLGRFKDYLKNSESVESSDVRLIMPILHKYHLL